MCSWSCNCRFPQGAQPQEIQQRKILYLGLYLLIWGEAANIRFMPECLCYIFHNVWFTFFLLSYSIAELIATMYLSCLTWHLRFSQMAYELHGLLAGNVSIVTGENIRPSYGGDEEAFLKKVVTPIYRVIRKVLLMKHHHIRLAISFPRIQILVINCRRQANHSMERHRILHGLTMMT